MPSVRALLLACLLLLGCPGEEPTATSPLTPLPTLDLSEADPAAREQIADLRKAVEEAPDDPAALAQSYGDLGLIYLTYEFLDAAEIALRNARTLRPEEARWTYLLAYLTMLQGRLDEAVDLYRGSLDLDPTYLPARLRLGRSLLEQGDAEAARLAFEEALESEPENAAALEGLGNAARALGDDSAAVGYFSRALEVEPQASSIHYALAQSYRNLGDTEKARFHLQQRGDVAARISDPLINPLASLAQSAQFYLVQGAEAMDDGNYEAAAAAFRAALDQDAQFLDARRGLALSLQRMGDLEGALETLGEALLQSEEPAEQATLLRLFGNVAAAAGQSDDALEAFLRSLAIEPDQPGVALRAGDALALRGRFEEAVRIYDKLLEKTPEWTATVLEKRAVVQVNLGRKEQALADFEKALAALPEGAPARETLQRRYGEALRFFGDENAAEQQLKEAQEKAPESLRAKAQKLAREGSMDEALKLYRQGLEATPDDIEARWEYASMLGHLGRLGEAVREFDEVLKRSPRHLQAIHARLVALVLSQRWGEARVAVGEALREYPRHVGLALFQTRLLAAAPDAAVRDGNLALNVVTRVYAERREIPVREALALAYAAAGETRLAAETQSALIAEMEALGAPVPEVQRERLAAFQAERAWSARSPQEIIGTFQ